jgi:hypothetical protein
MFELNTVEQEIARRKRTKERGPSLIEKKQELQLIEDFNDVNNNYKHMKPFEMILQKQQMIMQFDKLELPLGKAMKMKCLKFDQKINVTKKRMNLFSKKTG